MRSKHLPEIRKEQAPGILELGGARMALLDIEAGFWGIRRQMEALIGSRLTSAVLQQAGANGGASFASTFARQADLEKMAAFAACFKAYPMAGFGRFKVQSMEWPLGRIRIQASDAFEAWMYRRHHTTAETPVCVYSAGVFVGFVNILGERQDVVCIEHTCQAKGDEACLFELLPAALAGGKTIIPYLPDPGLGRQINLLEMLFERMPMGIAVLLFFTAAFLTLAWLGRIAPTIFQDQIPSLENTTSMFIQAMDLGIIVPVCVLAGILLLRREAWGYLLASVGLMKFLTMGTAVSLMAANMVRVGVPISVVELVIFPALALVNLVMVALLLKNIKD